MTKEQWEDELAYERVRMRDETPIISQAENSFGPFIAWSEVYVYTAHWDSEYEEYDSVDAFPRNPPEAKNEL